MLTIESELRSLRDELEKRNRGHKSALKFSQSAEENSTCELRDELIGKSKTHDRDSDTVDNQQSIVESKSLVDNEYDSATSCDMVTR